jgi:hypothetical protein
MIVARLAMACPSASVLPRLNRHEGPGAGYREAVSFNAFGIESRARLGALAGSYALLGIAMLAAAGSLRKRRYR